MAAGLSLAKHDFTHFKSVFADEIANRIDADTLQNTIYSDGRLDSGAINLDLAQQLWAAGPWGQGFCEPLFDGIFTVVEQRLVQQKHLQFTLRQDNKLFSAIAFNVNLQCWPNDRCHQIQIVYRLAINAFRGTVAVQLMIEHCTAL